MKSIWLYRLCPLLLVVAGCSEPVPPGRIRVKNDSRDREYNVIVVRGGGSSYTLSPDESALLPKGTSSISFTREYADYTRFYEVECPSHLDSGITIKLIDVHVNRMAGGCKTVNAGKE